MLMIIIAQKKKLKNKNAPDLVKNIINTYIRIK